MNENFAGKRWCLRNIAGNASPSDNVINLNGILLKCPQTTTFELVGNISKSNSHNGHPDAHFGLLCKGVFEIENPYEQYSQMLIDWHGDKNVYISVGTTNFLWYAMTNCGNKNVATTYRFLPLHVLSDTEAHGCYSRLKMSSSQWHDMVRPFTTANKTPKQIAEYIKANESYFIGSSNCVEFAVKLQTYLRD